VKIGRARRARKVRTAKASKAKRNENVEAPEAPEAPAPETEVVVPEAQSPPPATGGQTRQQFGL
jgi:hypothetical protein